jgi:hypothetical protein
MNNFHNYRYTALATDLLIYIHRCCLWNLARISENIYTQLEYNHLHIFHEILLHPRYLAVYGLGQRLYR